MELDTIKKVSYALVMFTLGVFILMPPLASADEVDTTRPQPHANEPRTTVQTRVESRPDGVYIHISVRETLPGGQGSDLTSGARPQSASAQLPDGNASSSTSAPVASAGSQTSAAGRSWTDKSGYHWQSLTGEVITLTPPNISTATRQSWVAQFQQHQNENPYLLYVDDQFNGIIWVPQSPSSNNITVVPAPASPPPPDTVVSGNGDSTDPREVALDALGHQPLPSAQIRMNPGLGLVAMPGWFWVEGYDGASFGTSRTVDIPPEVGSDVPVSVVPANDPRRRGRSFTVEVRIWPTRYEWSFGDGSSLVSQSLGRPYQAQSDIQHTYQHSSLGFASGFPVRLTISFAAEYRVNGGAPRGLPAIRRTYETGYRVQEVQPVLTNR